MKHSPGTSWQEFLEGYKCPGQKQVERQRWYIQGYVCECARAPVCVTVYVGWSEASLLNFSRVGYLWNMLISSYRHWPRLLNGTDVSDHWISIYVLNIPAAHTLQKACLYKLWGSEFPGHPPQWISWLCRYWAFSQPTFPFVFSEHRRWGNMYIRRRWPEREYRGNNIRNEGSRAEEMVLPWLRCNRWPRRKEWLSRGEHYMGTCVFWEFEMSLRGCLQELTQNKNKSKGRVWHLK